MKQIIVIVVLVAGIIGGAVLLGGGGDETEGVVSNNVYGNENASVTILEYADFECPACASFAPVISQVKEIYKDLVQFEFKHFPLVQRHPNSIAAHRAAEAAGKQGKFWEMHDILYQRQVSWRAQSTGAGGFTNTNAAETFSGYAQELGLDVVQFDVDVRADTTIGTINADIAQGRGKGVESTPTFYLNGELVEDIAQIATVEGFSALLDEALGRTNGGAQNDAAQEAPAEEVAKPEEETTQE